MAIANPEASAAANYQGIFAELRIIAARGRQVWMPHSPEVPLGPDRRRAADGGWQRLQHRRAVSAWAVWSMKSCVMPTSRCRGTRCSCLPHGILGFMAAAYLLREALNVGRRYLVAYACSHVRQDMNIKSGVALDDRSLEHRLARKAGHFAWPHFAQRRRLVRFLQVNFLDFFPALFTGLFALAAVIHKQPMLGAAMAGIIPVSLFLTARQIISQKGVRIDLMRTNEEIDGADRRAIERHRICPGRRHA